MSKVRWKNVLPRVLSGVKRCSVCSRGFHNTKKLRNHMKKRHLGKTSYDYNVYNKLFWDSDKRFTPESFKLLFTLPNVLSVVKFMFLWGSSMSTDKVMVQVNLCVCIVTGGSIMVGGEFACVHCNRGFHHGRNLKDHFRICSKRPITEVIQKHKCTLCGREYNCYPTNLCA